MKLNKFRLILAIISTLAAIALLVVYSASATTVYAQGRPGDGAPGRPSGGGSSGGGGGSSGGSASGEIRGVVTNLTTGQPAGGIKVSVNGSIVRTDSDGKYSVTGLSAGDYTVMLVLDGEGSAVQGPQYVNLPSGGLAIVDMQFVTGALPTVVATITAVATATPVPTSTAPELPTAGGNVPDNSYYLGNNYALASGAQTILPLSDAQNVVTPLMAQPVLPVPLCSSILVVPEENLPTDGSMGQYSHILEATNLLRVEDKTYRNTISLESIKPGYRLCIPVS